MSVIRRRIKLGGTVQGIGFRPFVHRLATQLGVAGRVRNAVHGAEIEAEGEAAVLDAFLLRLQAEIPPHGQIATSEISDIPAQGDHRFRIVESLDDPGDARTADIVPDLATCDDCLRELFDPADRRFGYPFINCTHCGPRFSIVEALPYDRAQTTMRSFTMCDACCGEYESPADRRFHAQPNACPACGPQLAWLDASGKPMAIRAGALEAAALAIERGEIVAMKGIGGFHLMADARNARAVAMLRERKHRPAKPFAVMMPSLDAARDELQITDDEAAWLAAPSAPIVILPRRATISLPDALAPGNPTLGILLPHSPLHHMMMRRLGFPVIATSGNICDEPICIDNEEAVCRLRGIADGFLMHDRPIARAVDDSVMRFVAGREMVLRRSRGLAPAGIRVTGIEAPVLACGTDLKGAIAIADAGCVRIGQHQGDLATVESRRAFEQHLDSFPRLIASSPWSVACDLHPAFHSRALAESCGLPVIEVQHHHAHAVACAAENGIAADEEFLAVVWDGTGYGADGTIWGGEFLICRGDSFTRFAWLRPFPLPGGDKSVRDPRFAALGCLHEAGIAVEKTPLGPFLTAEERRVTKSVLMRKIHASLCSSAGRLFDAVAALSGICRQSEFEGRAAMALEFAASSCWLTNEIHPEPWDVRAGSAIDWVPLLRRLTGELNDNATDIATFSHGFHSALADMIVAAAARAMLRTVVLSGGCFQNALLSELSIRRLRAAGHLPVWHRRVPPNDGGVAFGQAVIASRRLRAEDS